jgi:hypothetical protein
VFERDTKNNTHGERAYHKPEGYCVTVMLALSPFSGALVVVALAQFVCLSISGGCVMSQPVMSIVGDNLTQSCRKVVTKSQPMEDL